jgi:DNA-binding NtrC family response regulator
MSAQKKTVLVVDDESEIVISLKEFLTEEDFNVVTAGNVNDALRILKENPVDVVLSDISMPVKTGLDFYQEFRRDLDPSKKTAFVLMTGFADIISVENAFKIGVNELIAKPFDLESIALVLNYLTRSDRAYGAANEIYFAVPLEEFILSRSSDYDIFLRLADKYIKVTKSGQEFTAQRLDNFIKKGATQIYLNSRDFYK